MGAEAPVEPRLHPSLERRDGHTDLDLQEVQGCIMYLDFKKRFWQERREALWEGSMVFN